MPKPKIFGEKLSPESPCNNCKHSIVVPSKPEIWMGCAKEGVYETIRQPVINCKKRKVVKK